MLGMGDALLDRSETLKLNARLGLDVAEIGPD
jgi:hypothetical protein